jgi:hypothetical protein
MMTKVRFRILLLFLADVAIHRWEYVLGFTEAVRERFT